MLIVMAVRGEEPQMIGSVEVARFLGTSTSPIRRSNGTFSLHAASPVHGTSSSTA